LLLEFVFLLLRRGIGDVNLIAKLEVFLRPRGNGKTVWQVEGTSIEARTSSRTECAVEKEKLRAEVQNTAQGRIWLVRVSGM
jgi:hypothetical protein